MVFRSSNKFCVIVSISAPLFGVLGIIGYLVLIQYPYQLDYIQQGRFDETSFFTLIFLIIGILCGAIALFCSSQNAHRFLKYIFYASMFLSLIGIIALSLNPRLAFHSVLTAQNICINNVRQIEAAKEQWSHGHHATNGTVITWEEIAPYFTNGVPKCPEGGTYTLGRIGEPVLCSILNHRLPSD